MKSTTAKYFGDVDNFAIRFCPSETSENHGNCNLILGGQLIGNKYEFCYLVIWKIKIEMLIDKIKNYSNYLYHKEFNNRTNREIFELILKSDTEFSEDNVEFDYLPTLEYKIWHYCHLSIDETTSSYSIVTIDDSDKIKFMWEGFFEPCPIENIGELYHIAVEKQMLIDTLEKFLKEITK